MTRWGIVATAAWALWALTITSPPRARADVHDLELALGAGLLDRSTSGVGTDGDLDHELGLALDLGVRAFVGPRDGRSPADGGHCIHPGLSLRGLHAAGPVLGATGSYAYQTTIIDLAFALRSACLRLGNWLLTGYGGASLAVSSPRDVLGDAGAPSFVALGGHVGADLSFHFGPFLIGPFLDVRFTAALGGGPASRLSTAEIGLRMGYELDLPPTERPESRPRY